MVVQEGLVRQTVLEGKQVGRRREGGCLERRWRVRRLRKKLGVEAVG